MCDGEHPLSIPFAEETQSGSVSLGQNIYIRRCLFRAIRTHEDLLQKARSQDRKIQELLLQFEQMKAEKQVQKIITQHAYSGGRYDKQQQCMYLSG